MTDRAGEERVPSAEAFALVKMCGRHHFGDGLCPQCLDAVVRARDENWEQFRRVAEQLNAAEQRVAALQASVDGTHYHHKAFEPLCNHCQQALAALTPPDPGPHPLDGWTPNLQR